MQTEDMVWVPAGTFIYGENATQCIANLPYGFWIDRYPVTNAQYRAFLQEIPPGQENWMWAENKLAMPVYENHPVTGVTWPCACAYAAWRNARLPLEMEWEKAARGTGGRTYPWGEEFDETRCNVNSDGTTAVDHYGEAGASPYGCQDMAGNVWEWTASDSGTGNVFTWRDGQRQVGLPLKKLCGGSWAMLAQHARCAARSWDFTPIRGSSNVGFRCVRSEEPEFRSAILNK